jgi:hypothetical protein
MTIHREHYRIPLKFMELSPSWETSSSAAQELNTLWNPNVYYSVQKSLPVVPKKLNSTPWSEYASEPYWPSYRRLSVKWLPTFVDRGCHVVSVKCFPSYNFSIHRKCWSHLTNIKYDEFIRQAVSITKITSTRCIRPELTCYGRTGEQAECNRGSVYFRETVSFLLCVRVNLCLFFFVFPNFFAICRDTFSKWCVGKRGRVKE